MKKNLFRVLFISFFLLFMPLSAKAENFKIIDYNVDIEVKENNVYKITEKIFVHYTYSSHGIIRGIPIKNENIRKIDGKEIKTKFKAKISDVKVDNKFSTSKDNGNLNIKIGDPNSYADEYTTYNISYTYDLGDDNVEESDDVYFNIIGTEWNTTIDNVTFRIKMPKKFNEDDVHFLVGTYGATYDDAVEYSINGNEIIGRIIPTEAGYALYNNEALTAKINLPEGYFVNERMNFDSTLYILIFVLIVSVIIILVEVLLFKKYSYYKKDLLVPEFIAPDNLTPAEIGYLYDGTTKNKQIISLIIYLANKGYLEIIEEGKSFKFKKLKDIDEEYPDYVKKVFKGLFKKANNEGIVTKAKLEDSFYKTMDSAIYLLKIKHKIYKASHYWVCFFYICAMTLPFVFMSIDASILSYKKIYKFMPLYLSVIILLVIIFVISLLFIIFNRKREEKATKYYERIRGFKDYIENVEKDKINELVLENPNYFYDILPYAYVLGVSDKWSKNFESIAVEPPTWYSGTNFDTFNVVSFNNSLNKTINSASSSMNSRPYESSGGSSSGGFSGGGSGGGGGSSW